MMSGATRKLSISEVNSLEYDEFITKFGNVVEHCPLCPAAVWGYRPFRNFEEMQTKFDEFLNDLSIPGKAGILRLHPDLAGKLAHSGGLTTESVREQASAGMDKLTDDEREKMARLNTKYKNLFGFPFVICVRQNKKEAIMLGLDRRLKNNAETETIAGVDEVRKICSLRLRDLVDDTSVAKL